MNTVYVPRRGETRYYKKTSSTPRRDRMVRFKPCAHDEWRRAHRAEKATKGIEHLEHSRKWRSIARCASCTGGGLYRVTW